MIKDIEATGTIIQYNGKPAIMGIIRDITERKKTVEELGQAKGFNDKLIASIRDGISVVDIKGGRIEVNPALCEMTGFSREELLSQYPGPYWPPEGYEEIVTKLFSVYMGEIGEFETVLMRKNGERFPVIVSGASITDDQENAAYFAATIKDISKRKHMEEQLRIKDWAVNSSINAICLADLEGQLIYVNASFFNMWGYDDGENLGEVNTAELWQDRRKAVRIMKTLHKKGIWQGELIGRRKNGTKFDAYAQASIVKDDNSIPICMMVSFIDITEAKHTEEELNRYRRHLEELVEERTKELADANQELTIRIAEARQAEKALRESEQKYRELADLLPQIVFETDKKGGFTFVNRKAYKSFGYTEDEIEKGLNAFQTLVPEDRDRATANMRSVFIGKKSEGNEYTALRKDGSTFPVIIYSSPVMQGDRVVGLRGVVIDITERKQFEEALTASERRFRNLIEKSTDVVVIIDSDYKIRYESPSVKQVLGYKPEELIGRDGLFGLHPDDVSKATDDFTRLMENPDEIINTRIRYQHKNGTWRDIQAIGRNLLNDAAIQGIVVNFRDVTESRKAERELQEHYDEEKKLRKQLEMEMKRRVEFTRALAHELKTPLTSVLASSDLLASEVKNEPLLSLAKNIRQGANNLDSRIDELLDLAKGEVGILQLKTEPINLLQLLRETADITTALASGRGQSLVLALPHSLPMIEADGDRLQQIVTNLLNNAIKFTPKGGKITLRAKKKGSTVVVEVQDTGRGISREEQEQLFEPYQRLESDRDNLSGLGLGLTLCKTLVELHGGKIWVRSRVGKGSTFGFSLPLNAISQQKPEAEEESKLWKVLIIEDDQEIVDSISLTFQLRWPEAQLISTGLGEEGVELVETDNPDIVILDLGLPDIGGFDVLRQIRLFSHVPVIVLTVKDDEADMVKGLEWGADDYVVKPFRQLELISRLKVQIRKHAAPDEDAAIVCGSLRLDPATFQLTQGSKEISLTIVEGRIIEHLMRNAGRVVTHARLAEAVWGEDYPGAVDSLRVYIRYLRQKLETDPSHPKLIQTKSGVGYSLVKSA
jgi:two-component system KDP operon response regulator KdpE